MSNLTPRAPGARPERRSPDVVIDHVFVCTDAGGGGAERMVECGFMEGAPNTHAGQGTANRRFFFRSTMLELLWVSDPVEAQRDPARRTLLWDRWSLRASGACPFGIVLRPMRNDAGPPFAAWEYRPAYLTEPQALHIASEARLDEPMWVYAAFLRPEGRDVAHPNGVREITSVRLGGPATLGGQVTRQLAHAGLISVAAAAEHLLELEFDGGLNGVSVDLRQQLPLFLRW